MLKKVKAVVLALGLSLASACSSFIIEGDGQKAPAMHQETIHGSLYGFTWNQHDISKSGDYRGLYRVRVSTNGWYLLASAVTLGLYLPQDVQWWLQQPNPSGAHEWHPTTGAR